MVVAIFMFWNAMLASGDMDVKKNFIRERLYGAIPQESRYKEANAHLQEIFRLLDFQNREMDRMEQEWTSLLSSRAENRAAIEAANRAHDKVLLDLQEQLIDARFAMKEVMSEKEWRLAFGKDRSQGAGI